MNVRSFSWLLVLLACGEPLSPAGMGDVHEPPESKHPAGLSEKTASHDFLLDTVYDEVTDRFTVQLEDGTEVASGTSLWAATAYSWGDRSVAAWVDAASPTPALWIRLYRSSPGSARWQPTSGPISIDEADIAGELSLRAQAERIVIAYPASEYTSRLAAIDLSARHEPVVRLSEFFFMDRPGLSLSGEDDLRLAWFDQQTVRIAPVFFEAGRPVLGLANGWSRDEIAHGLETIALAASTRSAPADTAFR